MYIEITRNFRSGDMMFWIILHVLELLEIGTVNEHVIGRWLDTSMDSSSTI